MLADGSRVSHNDKAAVGAEVQVIRRRIERQAEMAHEIMPLSFAAWAA